MSDSAPQRRPLLADPYDQSLVKFGRMPPLSPEAAIDWRMTKDRARAISLTVTFFASWFYILWAGQVFGEAAISALNDGDYYRLLDAREAFSFRTLFTFPFVALASYWLTRLAIAAGQRGIRYMTEASRGRSQAR